MSLIQTILIAFLLMVLAGCGGTTGGSSNTPNGEVSLAASVGTLNYSDRVGTSFMFVFNLDEAPPPEGFEVQIFGPRGWNGGEPASRVYLYKEAGRYPTWVNVFEDNDGNSMEAVSGPYIIQAEIDGEPRRTEVDLDASELLPKPTNLTLTRGSTSTIAASWTAVPDAESYLVELFETETGTLDEPVTLYKTAPEVTLEGLNLTGGGEYRLGVSALPVDFTDEATKTLPQGQFNTSFTSQRFIAIAE